MSGSVEEIKISAENRAGFLSQHVLSTDVFQDRKKLLARNIAHAHNITELFLEFIVGHAEDIPDPEVKELVIKRALAGEGVGG